MCELWGQNTIIRQAHAWLSNGSPVYVRDLNSLIIKPADTLVPNGAIPSAGTVTATKSGPLFFWWSLEAAGSGFDFSNRSDKWHTPRWQHCWYARQISDLHDHYNIKSRGFEAVRDLAITRPSALWIKAQMNFPPWRFAQQDATNFTYHDDVIKRKHFPRNWPFVRRIHRSRWIPHTKDSDAELLMFSLTCVWINGWVNNREAGDLRRHRDHYDVIVMTLKIDLHAPAVFQ